VSTTPSDLPDPSFSPSPAPLPETPDELAWVRYVQPPVRRKFQHNYRKHLLFFGATFFTTTFPYSFAYVAGAIYVWWQTGTLPSLQPAFAWPVFVNGLWYSIPLLTILGAHEFGHYFACRYHNVDATLPFFIPAPFPPTGTFGAVIRIREAFPSKKALFDIGVAGPIAGFIALLPFLVIGLKMSSLAPMDTGSLYFGEPLLWKLGEWLYFGVLHIGPVPAGGIDVALHPMGFAAWWGMLATALNLLPFGQLDGGHIMYAALGRRAQWFSGVTLAFVLLLTIISVGWISMALMLVAMAFFFGFRHPRVIDEHEPLDPTRRLVALCALIIFILCFTPVPIEILGS
jgi:membrane-associated protease RseP (regulator of RpoE activity)